MTFPIIKTILPRAILFSLVIYYCWLSDIRTINQMVLINVGQVFYIYNVYHCLSVIYICYCNVYCLDTPGGLINKGFAVAKVYGCIVNGVQFYRSKVYGSIVQGVHSYRNQVYGFIVPRCTVLSLITQGVHSYRSKVYTFIVKFLVFLPRCTVLSFQSVRFYR